MPKKALQYEVTLTMGEFVTTGKSASLLEALEQAQPTFVKCQAVLEVKYGENKSALKLYPAHLRRFMVNKIYRLLLEKRLNAAMH